MFKSLKLFRYFFAYYWRSYLVIGIFYILTYFLAAIPPRLIGLISDRIVDRNITLVQLGLLCLLVLAIAILFYVLASISEFLLWRSEDLFPKKWLPRFMAKLLRQSSSFYAQNSTGSLMSKASSDFDSVRDLGAFGYMCLMDATLNPLSVLLVMSLSISWKLTLVALIPLPILAFLMQVIGKKVGQAWVGSQQAFDELNVSALESIQAVRIIRSYNAALRKEHEFSKKAEEACQKRLSVAKFEQLNMPLNNVLMACSQIFVLLLSTLLLARGELRLGDLLSFFVYLKMLDWPLRAVGDMINMTQEGLVSMKRVYEVIESPIDFQDRADAKPWDGKGDIVFDHFSFTYPNTSTPVLHDLSFTFKEGHTLGIVGRVGSGKSTLIKQFLRFYPSDEHFQIAGEAADHWQISSIRQKMGYVPQQQFLFSRSIRENIELGAAHGSADEAEIASAIQQADFSRDLAQLSHGLDTLTGEKGVTLSGGQKQRIAIARALLRKPDILILDDALSAVDAKTEARILSSLKKEREGKSTIIVAHRLSAVQHADLILVLDQGAIVERGKHQDLMKHNGWYAQQYQAQQLSQLD